MKENLSAGEYTGSKVNSCCFLEIYIGPIVASLKNYNSIKGNFSSFSQIWKESRLSLISRFNGFRTFQHEIVGKLVLCRHSSQVNQKNKMVPIEHDLNIALIAFVQLGSGIKRLGAYGKKNASSAVKHALSLLLPDAKWDLARNTYVYNKEPFLSIIHQSDMLMIDLHPPGCVQSHTHMYRPCYV